MEKREILKRKLDREVKSTSRLDCFAPTNLILLRPIKIFDWSFNRFNWAGRENQKERNLDNISSLDMAFIRRRCGSINYVYDFKSLAILCETFDDVAIFSEKLKIWKNYRKNRRMLLKTIWHFWATSLLSLRSLSLLLTTNKQLTASLSRLFGLIGTTWNSLDNRKY